MAVTAHVFTKAGLSAFTKKVDMTADTIRVILATIATTGLAAVQDTAQYVADVKAAVGWTEIANGAGGSNYVQNANSTSSGVALTAPFFTEKVTTVAAGSNGVNTSTFAGAGTLNVVTTAPVGPAFPATGTLEVATGTSQAIITYTGITGTTFTGCTTTSGGGVLATGGAVTASDHVYTFTTASNPTWTNAAAGFAPAYAVFLDSTPGSDATNPVLGWWDLGGASPGGNGSWALQLSTAGILSLTGS